MKDSDIALAPWPPHKTLVKPSTKKRPRISFDEEVLPIKKTKQEAKTLLPLPQSRTRASAWPSLSQQDDVGADRPVAVEAPPKVNDKLSKVNIPPNSPNSVAKPTPLDPRTRTLKAVVPKQQNIQRDDTESVTTKSTTHQRPHAAERSKMRRQNLSDASNAPETEAHSSNAILMERRISKKTQRKKRKRTEDDVIQESRLVDSLEQSKENRKSTSKAVALAESTAQSDSVIKKRRSERLVQPGDLGAIRMLDQLAAMSSETESEQSPHPASNTKTHKRHKRDTSPVQVAESDGMTQKSRRQASRTQTVSAPTSSTGGSRHGKELIPQAPGHADNLQRIPRHLDSQHSMMPSDHSTQSAKSPVKPNKTKKRKGTAPEARRITDEDMDSGHEPASHRKKANTADAKTKSSRSDQPGREMAISPVGERGMVQGPFTHKERELADQIFRDVCLSEGISEWDLKRQIVDWASASIIKIEMNQNFPYRTLDAIRKFCKRRYNVYDRGAWTEEQDDALRDAYVKYPDRWTEIGMHVGRFSSDCRDRYRNTIQLEETMERGPWHQDEENQLVAAVEESIVTVKNSCKDKDILKDPERLEGMISWKVVAGKMHGKRTAKRCQEKWLKMKSRKNKPTNDASSDKMVPIHVDENCSSRLFDRAEKALAMFEGGDFYDVLKEIHTAIDDHNKVFVDETTVWSIVAMKNVNSRFSSALRRCAYYYSLKRYGHLKRIRKKQTIAAKSRSMSKIIKKSVNQGTMILVRGYNPEPRVKRTVTKPKSKQTVSDDDDGDEIYSP